ncbi:ELMO domain [Phytophthora cactorum]|nr:ELMO domain [Phytophthora cactorum]
MAKRIWTRTIGRCAAGHVASGHAGSGSSRTALATKDFATSAQMGEIYALRQTARTEVELQLVTSRLQGSDTVVSCAEDDDMLQHLWSGLFPTLPYEGRVNNDDPASDLRTSGRLAIRMLLYFSDHLNDEFKRMVRENRFPVCLCALNLLEICVSLETERAASAHLSVLRYGKAELETSQQPSRSHPELQGGPAEIALAHVFATRLVMDAVWKQQLQRDPTTTLMHSANSC